MSITVKHDGSFDIATGKSRKETNWRNKEMSWTELVKKLSTTHRTAEKLTEYLAAKKDRQDEIKDVGAFCGGFLSTGSRKKGNVLHRQLITLDIDFATKDFWDDFTVLYGNAACLHSTHKHSPDKPRLRLIMPLNRPVFADEYMAIAHKIAGVLDIELFDPTTFQPERLMYWPSTSKDGEFLFEYQDAEWLDADAVLASYTDWKDSSSWPVSVRVDKVVQRNMVKQGDPTEKPGVIGAWCRTYGIAEAIETFLGDFYDTSDIENRYTYKHGSTAGGLVVYEDKFAYSHHGSDPVSGKLSNAFDLVRIHKFGLRDDVTSENTPTNKRPSYLAMIDFAAADPKVKKMMVVEKMESAKTEFNDVSDSLEYVTQDVVDNDWVKRFETDRKGKPFSTANNQKLIFENDPYFKNKIAYDDFEKCEVAITDLPWRKVTHQTRRLTDRDDAEIRVYIETVYSIHNPKKTEDAMKVLSNKTSFHPVRSYLKSLKWDGVNRVDTLFIDYMNAVDSAYTRTVTRKTLCAACARVFEPGIKFDTMLTFVGKQGLGKSSLIGKLGKQWFSDSFKTVHGNAAIEQLQGVWIVEVAELAGLKKGDIEAVKSYLSQKEDRYRVAYGRRVEHFPRQCIFFGSTNRTDFLIDPTGNRRFWPVAVSEGKTVKNIFQDLTSSEVDQVWAEAYNIYEKGETLYLPESMIATATQIQKNYTQEHPWTSLIQNYLETKLPEGWKGMQLYDRRNFLSGQDDLLLVGTIHRTRVCVLEIWEEAIKDRNTIDERASTIIRNIMQNIEEWVLQPKTSRYTNYGTQRNGYFRKGLHEELLPETTQISVTNPVTDEEHV